MQAFRVKLALFKVLFPSGEVRKASRAMSRAQLHRHALNKGLRFKPEPGALFGGYYVGPNGTSFKVDVVALRP